MNELKDISMPFSEMNLNELKDIFMSFGEVNRK